MQGDPESGSRVGATEIKRREPTLLYIIKQLELATRSRLDDIFRPIGMTALQYTALTVLEHHPDISGVQLARNSFVTPQSMADMIETLGTRGLLERHPDPRDRRRLLIALTPDGRAMLEKYRPVVADLETSAFADLSPDEVAGLRRALQTARDTLEKQAVAALAP
ncbi:MAG: MarR family winged helix-turn-helix transcriptional regulator [Leifsonia sp.]